MSIDEMCKYVEDYVQEGDMSDMIIDLLRAGQLMRRSFDTTRESYHPIYGHEELSLASDINRKELSLAGQAWDEALRETEERL